MAPWLPGRLVSPGTDGFGRNENREHLRRRRCRKLARDGQFEVAKARAAFAELGVDTEKIDPMLA